MNLSPRDVLIRPLITEKSHEAMERGTYTFEVHPQATKADIHNAVEEIFKVRVVKVNTVNMKGKPRRLGVQTGRTSSWKKAMVTLAPGERIQALEGI